MSKDINVEINDRSDIISAEINDPDNIKVEISDKSDPVEVQMQESDKIEAEVKDSDTINVSMEKNFDTHVDVYQDGSQILASPDFINFKDNFVITRQTNSVDIELDTDGIYSDEKVQDTIWNNFTVGNNLTFNYDDQNDVASLQLTNSIYTDEDAQDAVGLILNEEFVYDDQNDEISLSFDADLVDKIRDTNETIPQGKSLVVAGPVEIEENLTVKGTLTVV